SGRGSACTEPARTGPPANASSANAASWADNSASRSTASGSGNPVSAATAMATTVGLSERSETVISSTNAPIHREGRQSTPAPARQTWAVAIPTAQVHDIHTAYSGVHPATAGSQVWRRRRHTGGAVTVSRPPREALRPAPWPRRESFRRRDGHRLPAEPA